MKVSEALGIKPKNEKNKRKRYVSLVVIITGILSIGFAIISFYGLQTGTFAMTMRAEAKKKGIQLSETLDFENYTTRLFSNPTMDALDITYIDLNIEEAVNTNGKYTDPNLEYVAYTFYVRNSGREMINLNYTIKLYDVYEDLDEGIRILVIEDDLNGTVTEEMYQKPDEVEKEYYNMPDAIEFLDDELVTNKTFQKFQIGQIRKITFFMWIEGQDSEDYMLSGGVKFRMEFSVMNADV
jgi:hypothetical protein